MLKIIISCIFASLCCGHSLKAFISQEGEFAVVKSYFYRNSPCKDCEISVFLDNKIIAHSKTDNNGNARIKLDMGEFEFLIDGGLGHEKRVKFTLEPLSRLDLGDVNSSKNLQENPNSDNHVNSQESGFANLISFLKAFLIIFVFFGFLYLVKKR